MLHKTLTVTTFLLMLSVSLVINASDANNNWANENFTFTGKLEGPKNSKVKSPENTTIWAIEGNLLTVESIYEDGNIDIQKYSLTDGKITSEDDEEKRIKTSGYLVEEKDGVRTYKIIEEIPAFLITVETILHISENSLRATIKNTVILQNGETLVRTGGIGTGERSNYIYVNN